MTAHILKTATPEELATARKIARDKAAAMSAECRELAKWANRKGSNREMALSALLHIRNGGGG